MSSGVCSRLIPRSDAAGLRMRLYGPECSMVVCVYMCTIMYMYICQPEFCSHFFPAFCLLCDILTLTKIFFCEWAMYVVYISLCYTSVATGQRD